MKQLRQIFLKRLIYPSAPFDHRRNVKFSPSTRGPENLNSEGEVYRNTPFMDPLDIPNISSRSVDLYSKNNKVYPLGLQSLAMLDLNTVYICSIFAKI